MCSRETLIFSKMEWWQPIKKSVFETFDFKTFFHTFEPYRSIVKKLYFLLALKIKFLFMKALASLFLTYVLRLQKLFFKEKSTLFRFHNGSSKLSTVNRGHYYWRSVTFFIVIWLETEHHIIYQWSFNNCHDEPSK